MKNKKSLYIHVPFCETKCFYCSFAVSVGQEKRAEQYIEALACEAAQYKGEALSTIYIGGGTPSHLSVEQIARMFDFLVESFDCSNIQETTFEANPESICPDKAKLLRSLGVDRVSVGIQTFSKDYLKFLGRKHEVNKAREAVNMLKQAGFDNINVDLMYGFPDQTAEQILDDVSAFKSLNCQHISLYALTLEEKTRLHTRKIVMPGNEKQAEFYDLVRTAIEAAGYSQYEISNFAVKGFESIHNLNYWQAGEYIGLGVGAHGYIKSRRFWNVSGLLDYLKRVEAGKSILEGEETLSEADQFKLALLFGLRMNRGVDMLSLEKRYGQQLSVEDRNIIQNLIDEGYMMYDNPYYSVTDRGRLVLDEISVRLI